MNKRVNRYSARSAAVLSNFCYLALCAAVGGWLLWDAMSMRVVTLAPGADYWEHTALLTEWLENFSRPGNPQVDAPALSPLFMPYFWVLTLVGRTFGIAAEALLAGAAVVNFLLLVVGLKLFTQSYFRNAWAPVVAFIVLFTFWGAAWNLDNVYQLRSLFFVASYPSTFAFALSLFAFWTALMLLRGVLPLAVMAPVLGVLLALQLLCDPVTGVFGLTGCALLIITETAAMRGTVPAALLALLVGVVATELWPYFSLTKLMLGLYDGSAVAWLGDSESLSLRERFARGDWAHPLYELRMIVAGLGVALLGVPVLLWLLVRREHMFIVLGACAMALPYALNLFVEVPSAPRYLLFVATYLQLAIVWAWLRLFEAWNEIPRPALARPLALASVAGAVLMLAGNVWLATLEFGGTTFNTRALSVVPHSSPAQPGEKPAEFYARLLAPVADDDAVILATADAGWPVPAVRGKIVVLKNPNPLVADQRARYKDATDFFFRPVSSVRRAEIVQRYGADYVLLDLDNPSRHDDVTRWLIDNATVVSSAGSYRLLEVSPAVYAVEIPVAQTEQETLAQESPRPANTNAPARPAAPRPARPAAPAAATDEASAAEAEADDSARSFGAPITAPILDPELNGA